MESVVVERIRITQSPIDIKQNSLERCEPRKRSFAAFAIQMINKAEISLQVENDMARS